MKISELWLRERVSLADISRERLLERLTAVGLEVEAATPVAAEFVQVVVGHIVAIEQHPNADKLRVCQVDVGAVEPLQIVCGAPNARLGLAAPLALEGAILPNGLVIKASKLRGVDSFGMLCSAAELGLDPDASGLLELDHSCAPGAALGCVLALDDVSIELKMTPNRSDCLGVRGLARELSAVFDRPLIANSRPQSLVSVAVRRDIQLLAQADCPRYLGQQIIGLNDAAPTPLWMREKLRRSGLRSIHPLVDITNYVLLETGQPMHAFDADQLQGAISVRRGAVGESLQLLDERIVAVDQDCLLIADLQGPVALAGVMGGFRTRVHAGTHSVFFESAHFAPAAIMGRARRFGLTTDAGYRFERGVDPNAPEAALALAVSLTLEIMGGQLGPVVVAELAQHLKPPAEMRLRRHRLAQVLGLTVSDAEVETLLTRLGCHLHIAADGWQVQAPSARFDLQIEEDLIEEVARLVGYERIPLARLPTTSEPRIDSESRVPASVLRHRLQASGYQEAITFAFTSETQANLYGLSGVGASLCNPLSADMAVMRASLVPPLVQAALQNMRRQAPRVRLFELGRVFLDQGKREVTRIAAVAIGSAVPEQWAQDARAPDFFDLKGDVETLLQRPFTLTPSTKAWLHPGRSAEVLVDGMLAGVLGQLHPLLQANLDSRDAIWVMEFDVAALSVTMIPNAAEISRFPGMRRDLAPVLDQSVSFAQVEAVIRAAAGSLLRECVLFNEYRGPGLGEASRSLAIGLIFQEDSRTLKDAEVDAAVGRCIEQLTLKLHAVIRR